MAKKFTEKPTWAWYRKKIVSFFPYQVIDNKIVLGKNKFTLRQFSVLAYLIRFLALMLIGISLYAFLATKNPFNMISLIIAILFMLMGFIYKWIAQEAKLANKKKEEEINKC